MDALSYVLDQLTNQAALALRPILVLAVLLLLLLLLLLRAVGLYMERDESRTQAEPAPDQPPRKTNTKRYNI